MQNNMKGIGAIILGSICFSVNDISIKIFSSEYALHQLMFFRALFAIVILIVVVLPLYGGLNYLSTKNPIFHMFRGMTVVGANTFFFISIAKLSIAEATAIFFIAPILITILAYIFLNEKVGIRRGIACVLGFIGMIFVVKPGTISFEIVSIFPLIAALFYSVLHIITRKYGAAEKPITMGFYIQVCFFISSVVFGIFFSYFEPSYSGNNMFDFLLRPWIIPELFDITHIFFGIAVPISVGGILVSYAYKNHEASLLAPFEYVALVVAVASTYLIWNELPDPYSFFGILLIMLSGIFVSLREKEVSKLRTSRKIITRR